MLLRLRTASPWQERIMIFDSVVRAILRQLSREGREGRLSILIFHRVLPEADRLFPDEVDKNRFAAIVDWLTRWFNVISLDEAVERLAAGSLPQPICLHHV